MTTLLFTEPVVQSPEPAASPAAEPIVLRIEGLPKGQPRHKPYAMKMGDKWVGRVHPDPGAGGKIDSWRDSVTLAAQNSPRRPLVPLSGPIRVDLVLLLPRPKGHYGGGRNAQVLKGSAPAWCTAKPDRDNAEKLILDVLTKLRYWLDDKQVCAGEVRKYYANEYQGQRSGAIVLITPLDEAGGEAFKNAFLQKISDANAVESA
ncbi:MAG: RusA family crossover junction endodeoxyribonuclease [Planctomycetaceae bacterium]|nr:RusA family crossover junction endodeoxyribonuclease [Planctomycetaceae bacterium]